MVLVMLAVVSGLSFLYYGSTVLVRLSLRQEFERYGMRPGLRIFVGVVELLGGAGVLLGLAAPRLGAAAAAGLCTLMLLGLIVRFRLRDAPRLMAPAAALAAVNAALFVLFVAG